MSPCDLTNLNIEVELLSACLLVPLSIRTEKEEVIVPVVSFGWGGLSEEDLNLRGSLMYMAKYCWFWMFDEDGEGVLGLPEKAMILTSDLVIDGGLKNEMLLCLSLL
jgi:hypothetical protein